MLALLQRQQKKLTEFFLSGRQEEVCVQLDNWIRTKSGLNATAAAERLRWRRTVGYGMLSRSSKPVRKFVFILS